tara:strand:- start:655 stop:972 length:318 start_codon:yes stop_codon:yes gene_type:complete
MQNNNYSKYFDARDVAESHLKRKKGGPGYPVENSAQTARNNPNDMEEFKLPRSQTRTFLAEYMNNPAFAENVEGFTEAFKFGNSRIAREDWPDLMDPTMNEGEAA